MTVTARRPAAARAPRRPRWPLAMPAVALLVVVAAVVAVMSHTAPRLALSNDARLAGYPIAIEPGERFCQSGERVPPDAAQLDLEAGTEGRPGPPLLVTVEGRTVRVGGGYRDGPVSVALPERGLPGATVCVANRGGRRVFLGGQTAALAIPPGLSATLGGEPVAAVARILYWRAGEESGWQIAGSVLNRWSRVTALGAATPYLAIALLLAACAGAVTFALRARAGALACGAVALAAAAGWALTTPAFQVPDEPQHLAYAQYLAETGKLPRPVPGKVFSPEEGVVFAGVEFNHVAGNRSGRPPWFADQERAIEAALARDPGRDPDGGQTNTTNNPPLYYALQVVPLKLTSSGDFLDRLLAMRLLSALLAALTGAFAFLFLRELLPRTPWAWPAGALALAVQPLLGFLSGGVNNDAGMFAAGAAILWCVARVFRRGLERGTAIGIGVALGLGLVTKATLIGLVPGLLVALVVLLRRTEHVQRRRTLRLAAVALAMAAAPVVVYVVLNATVWDRPLWSAVPGTDTRAAGHPATIREFVSYLWQFYLPRLPFMNDLQSGLPLYNVWFKGFIAKYGWLDTTWPGWAYGIAVAVYAGVLALALNGLRVARARLAERAGELLTYAVLVGGFLLIVGWAGYTARLANGSIFEQTRYLLPLGALYAGIVTVAALGAGRRLGPAVGATLVVLACGHALLSALLVVGRYYA